MIKSLNKIGQQRCYCNNFLATVGIWFWICLCVKLKCVNIIILCVCVCVQRETYKLEAMAQDKGYPPLSRTVEVQIDVVDRANNPPVWDNTVYGPIYVKENMPVGGKVVSIKARSVSLYFPNSIQINKHHQLHFTHSNSILSRIKFEKFRTICTILNF